MAGRFLGLFKPLARILPEIKKPERKVSFNEKIFWTGTCTNCFPCHDPSPTFRGCCHLNQTNLAQLRVIFASNRGTLMELGIGPIVTAGLILQLLAGSSIIRCDMSNSEDRGLFTIASKVFSILLTGIQAGAYIISGMYGPARSGRSYNRNFRAINSRRHSRYADGRTRPERMGTRQRNQPFHHGWCCPKHHMGHVLASQRLICSFTFTIPKR